MASPQPPALEPTTTRPRFRPEVFGRILLVVLLLAGFLVAIKCMGGAFKLMGQETSGALFDGVANPFTALAVGILATVLVQSSSTTTATIVALVGSGELSVEHAVPMIMGANIGTTITNTLVSVGHVRQSASFRRAFAAATVHDFFNLMCVAVLLPFELATGFLSKTALYLTDHLAGGPGAKFDSPVNSGVKVAYKGVLAAFESLGLRVVHQVALVDDDHVGELDLVGQEIDDRAFVLLAHAHLAVVQAVLAVEVPEEVGRVDHGHHGVEARQVGERAAVFGLEGEGLGDRDGLRDTRGLDQQVVEAPLAGEAGHLFEQVLPQGAADAAVGHLDQRLFGARERRAAALDERRTAVDFSVVCGADFRAACADKQRGT